MTRLDDSMPSYCGWLGSKSGQANTVLIPRLHPLAYKSYVEVFAGGAGLFFRKAKATLQSILNDKDPDVLNMHERIAGDTDAVMAEMEKLRPSRLTFEETKRLRESSEWWDLPKVQRAARTLYLVKTSVNGTTRGYAFSAKTGPTFNPHFDLRPFARKLERVQFECLDWRELLDRLVFKRSETQLFLYCDPPYVASTKVGHYRFNFDHIEHVLFARALCRINALNARGSHEVRVMVSYDDEDVGLIRSLYRPEFGWWIEPVAVRYGAENRATNERHELVITNYDPSEVKANTSTTPSVDWSDLPATDVSMDGRTFEQLSCCEKEVVSLICKGLSKGQCRACGTKLTARAR